MIVMVMMMMLMMMMTMMIMTMMMMMMLMMMMTMMLIMMMMMMMMLMMITKTGISLEETLCRLLHDFLDSRVDISKTSQTYTRLRADTLNLVYIHTICDTWADTPL